MSSLGKPPSFAGHPSKFSFQDSATSVRSNEDAVFPYAGTVNRRHPAEDEALVVGAPSIQLALR